MRMPDVIMDRPFEVLVGFLCVQSGIVMAIFGIAPVSVTATLPAILIHIWGSVLALGGSLLLSGIYARYVREKFLLGLLIERAGYYPLVSGTLAYSAIIIYRAGLDGAFPSMTYLVFATICALRYHRVSTMLRHLRRLERDG